MELFTAPIDFKEAIQSVTGRKLLPTLLSSEELSAVPVAIRERAFFSARVFNAELLQRLKDLALAIISPSTETRETGVTVSVGTSIAEARGEIKDFLDSISYQAVPGQEGSIQDLRTDQRLNLILKTQTEMAQGYGWFAQGQDQGVLDAFPCQEFYRAEDRKEPRDWPARWAAAGGQFYPGDADYPQGRMIAAKDDGIWQAISAFDQPYPPFDFNSGMDLRDIDREEALSLGVITADDTIQPQDATFNDLEAGASELDPDIAHTLLSELPGYVIKDGTLQQEGE